MFPAQAGMNRLRRLRMVACRSGFHCRDPPRQDLGLEYRPSRWNDCSTDETADSRISVNARDISRAYPGSRITRDWSRRSSTVVLIMPGNNPRDWSYFCGMATTVDTLERLHAAYLERRPDAQNPLDYLVGQGAFRVNRGACGGRRPPDRVRGGRIRGRPGRIPLRAVTAFTSIPS